MAVAASVAVAFADSSIVVLALPDLYGAFNTSIVGVSWVITSYNLVVAVVAGGLALLGRRLDPRRGAQAGPRALHGRLDRLRRGVGSAGADRLPLRPGIRRRAAPGDVARAARRRCAARGPRAPRSGRRLPCSARRSGRCSAGCSRSSSTGARSSSVQAPVAAVALLATGGAVALEDEAPRRRKRGALAADAALGLVFAALVGALFLAVLLVITVWGLEPITGALVVSTLPAATLLARSLGRGLSPWAAVWGGAALLAAGLVALALLPRVSNALVAIALAFCGIGLGLAVPVLTRASLDADAGIVRSGAITVSARHAGLVLGLALVAPLLHELARQRRRARAPRRDEGDPRRERADQEEGADRPRASRRAREALRRARCPTSASRSTTRARSPTTTCAARGTTS